MSDHTLTVRAEGTKCKHGYSLGKRHWWITEDDGTWSDYGPNPLYGDRLGANECPGGREIVLREVDPKRVAILSDDEDRRYRIYLEEVSNA